MKKFDNLQAAIHNLKDIYSYQGWLACMRYVLNKHGKQ